jgi:Transglycosylase SLT domain/SPOR domain
VQVVTRFCLALLLIVAAAPISAQEPATDDPLDHGKPSEKASAPATTPGGASAQKKTTAPEGASGQGKASRPSLSTSSESICLLVEAAARANGLPVEFFIRVIWQESRFRPDEVGPLTRSGGRAQGIAQFMPQTAQERRLLDPFDPVQALPKAAEFLRELRQQFGNLGLAAAAYNAGPQRVRDWMAGKHAIPAETRHYVSTVTGRSIDEWLPARNLEPAYDRLDHQALLNCPQQVIALLNQQPIGQQPTEQANQPEPNQPQPNEQPTQPNQFVGALMRRVELGITSPWGVQLSASFSRDQALNIFEDVAKRYSGILKGSDPMIVQSILRSRGTHPFYQVRIGKPTRADADALCARIQHAGGPCMVLRNLLGST